MKKILFIVTVFLCLIFCASCTMSVNSTNKGTNPSIESQKVNNASDYVQNFESAGFPLVNIIVYDENNDVNKLLGRPGQYTSKVSFGDQRVEQIDKENPVGGTVEVFSKANDLNSRKKYIESLQSLAKQYIYVSKDGLALLRIDFDLTPEQADEYNKVFIGEINKVDIKVQSSASPLASVVPSETENAEQIPSPSVSTVQASDSGTLGDYTVSILNCEQIKDYKGKAAIRVYFSFTNNSTDTESFLLAVHPQAFQNGVELDTAIIIRKNVPEDNNIMKDVKPGASIKVAESYILSDKSPVEIDVSTLFNEGNSLTKTFTLK